MKMKIGKKRESGRSMIEIVGVLGVMGLITAGAFVLIRSGSATQKLNRVKDDVAMIAENIRGVYAESDDFSGLTDVDAEGTALIDALYLNTTTPFGQNTKYSVVRDNTAKGFVVKLSGLTSQDCNALAKFAWPNSTTGATCNNGVVSVTFSK